MLDLWYKTAIIYSLNVASYRDSNGDGIGDFKGLASRLDHIAKLGATCLWLLPIFPSPRLDYGYDVTDYYNVAPWSGTLGDFVEFTHQARLRGLRILIDLPLNHTSDQHPWFQAARNDPKSRYHDFYVWSKEKPKDIDSGVAFPGFQSSVWSWDDKANAWYFHRFYKYQPDLNIDNPEVRDEIKRIMGFWLELGVAGFRLDATPFLITEVRPDGTATPHYRLLNEMREFLSWRRGDAILLAEANVAPDEISKFVSDQSRVQMAFAFIVNQLIYLALARHQAEPLVRALDYAGRIPDLGQWAQFLRNHDELDLDRLSEEERQDVYDAFAPDPSMRLFGRGIRRRVAPMLGGDRRRIELANSLMFSMPGSPVIFYGDEIGMGDELSLPERWPVRTPMQWSAGRNGGFSSAPADKLVHPLVSGQYGPDKVNVVAEQRDPDSLFSWMRRLCDVRQSCPEIGWGRWSVIETDHPATLAHRFCWGGQTTILLHNLDEQGHDVGIKLDDKEAGRLVDLFGDQTYEPTKGERQVVALDGYGYRWFRVETEA